MIVGPAGLSSCPFLLSLSFRVLCLVGPEDCSRRSTDTHRSLKSVRLLVLAIDVEVVDVEGKHDARTENAITNT